MENLYRLINATPHYIAKNANPESTLNLMKGRSPSLFKVKSGLESRSPNFSSSTDNTSTVHKLDKINSNQNKHICKSTSFPSELSYDFGLWKSFTKF